MCSPQATQQLQSFPTRHSSNLWRASAGSIGRVNEIDIKRQECRTAAYSLTHNLRHLRHIVLAHLTIGQKGKPQIAWQIIIGSFVDRAAHTNLNTAGWIE